MANFFTRKGDDGSTGLISGERIPKNHPIAVAIGDLDEVNASIGVARAHSQSPITSKALIRVQQDLYKLMTEVSAVKEINKVAHPVNSSMVLWLEQQVESITETIEVPNQFIIPGDSRSAAYLDLARTITRRAERSLAQLLNDQIIGNWKVLQYINRLSSLLFILELVEIDHAGLSAPTFAKDPLTE